MPEWWPRLLLFVFASHMPFFLWRWRRTGEARHGTTALTFALLAVAYALRVFAPAIAVGETPVWKIARAPAWIAAAVSLTLLAQYWWRRARG